MADYDLTTKEGIRQVYETEFLPLEHKPDWQTWLANYVRIVELVRDHSVEELASPEMQAELWESTDISGSGMCTIPMTEAIQSEDLAKWIAFLKDRELLPAGQPRIEELKTIHAELLERTKPFTKRRPWLKFMRLMAAIFPKDISCLVDYDRLRLLANAMLGKIPRGQLDMVTLNALIYQEIDEAIGPPQDDPTSLAKRSMFAWELYRIVAEKGQEEAGEVEGQRPGESTLNFLPVERRTKGISAFQGYVNTALKILDFVQNGATVSEAVAFYQEEFPNIKESSAKSQLSTIRHTLGLLRLDGNTLHPSPLGEKLLDTAEPTILIPRVLTRVIGFDLILYDLKTKGSLERAELFAALKEHYPKWTTDFAPSALVAWAEKLGMIEFNDQQRIVLTEVGQEWADQITERPTPIGAESEDGEVVVTTTGETRGPVQLMRLLFVWFFARRTSRGGGTSNRLTVRLH